MSKSAIMRYQVLPSSVEGPPLRCQQTVMHYTSSTRNLSSHPCSRTSHHHAATNASSQTHLTGAKCGWGLGGLPHETQCSLEVLVPEFHFSPLTPHCCQVIHVLQLHLSGLVKDHSSIGNIPMTLIELSKRHPKGVWLANSLQKKSK